jgi:DmsE family decaheme c-type cytochrome
LAGGAEAQSPNPLKPASPPSQSQYVGSSVCATCHREITDVFNKNAHYRSIALANQSPEKTGCEGCHGPAYSHIAAGGGAATIRSFKALKPAQVLDTCLSCHAKDFPRANIRRSAHTLADVVCTNCHSIHSAAAPKFLLAKAQTQLCYQCHTGVRAQFSMPFKHRVNEGAINCTDCHNPHGTFSQASAMGTRSRLMEAATGGEQSCLRCHTDKRGPFAFEHAAVRVDGCQTCHVAHGSTNARMLKRPVVFTMCLECHNGAGGFGRNAGQNGSTGIPTQTPSHNMGDPRYQNCTTCHVRIHGSNADPRFLR